MRFVLGLNAFCVWLKCILLSAQANEQVGLCCKGLEAAIMAVPMTEAIMSVPMTEAIMSVPMTEASHHVSAHSLGP